MPILATNLIKQRLLKKYFMKTFHVFVFFMVLPFQSLLSQNTNYKLIKQEQGVQFFAREMECHDNWNGIHQLFYQIQVINTTEMQATITWNIDTWMDGACVTCGKVKNNENTYTIELPPSGSLDGNCDKNGPKGLKVYIKELQNNKSSVLSKFEITNLKVEFHE